VFIVEARRSDGFGAAVGLDPARGAATSFGEFLLPSAAPIHVLATRRVYSGSTPTTGTLGFFTST